VIFAAVFGKYSSFRSFKGIT